MLELLLTLSTDSSFNTYHVGNSLTWDSSPSNLGALGEHPSSTQIQNGWHIRCGMSLDYIYSNPTDVCVSPTSFGTWDQALTEKNSWDALTIQPFPRFTSTFLSDVSVVNSMADQCFQNDGFDKKIFIYSGWPWQSEAGFVSDWNRPVGMDGAQPTIISSAYMESLVDELRSDRANAVYLIPVGQVLYNLGISLEQDPFEYSNSSGEMQVFDSTYSLYRDQYHLDLQFGRYVALMTMYTCLVGEMPYFVDGISTGVGTVPLAWHQRIEGVIQETLAQSERTGLRWNYDFNDDGVVDFADVLAVLVAWGTCQYCEQDVDRDGEVGFAELIGTLNNWGV